MTRQGFLAKWFLYALGLLPVLLLELVVFSRFRLFGTVPVLLPLCVTALAGLEGSLSGAGFGLAVGLIADAVYPGVPGGMTLGLAIAGTLSGTASRYGLRQSFLGMLLSSAAVLIVISVLHVVPFLARGIALPVLLGAAAGELLWSLAFTPIIYLLYRRIHRKVERDVY